MNKLRTVSFAAALLVAGVPSLSTTAEARPFGFGHGFGHVGFGHAGFGHRWGGGWGWGGAGVGLGLGLATGALVGAALAGPYAYDDPYYVDYLPPPPPPPVYVPAYRYRVVYRTPYWRHAYRPYGYRYYAYRHYRYPHYSYRHYGYGVRHAAYGVSRIGYGGYRVHHAGYEGGLRYGRSVGHTYKAGFAGGNMGYGHGRFR